MGNYVPWAGTDSYLEINPNHNLNRILSILIVFCFALTVLVFNQYHDLDTVNYDSNINYDLIGPLDNDVNYPGNYEIYMIKDKYTVFDRFLNACDAISIFGYKSNWYITVSDNSDLTNTIVTVITMPVIFAYNFVKLIVDFTTAVIQEPPTSNGNGFSGGR